MSDNPYYKFYVGDYDRKTAGLSMLEHGAYRLLLDHYYSMREPLPGDIKILYRICRAFSPTERKAVQEILSKFFKNHATRYVSERCDAEICKMLEYSNSQSAKANLRHSRGTASAIVTTTREEREGSKKTTNVVQKAERFSVAELPEPWNAFCREKRPELNPVEIFQQFADYWAAKPGKDAKKLDWFATWRNWVRNQKQTMEGQAYEKQSKWIEAAEQITRKRQIQLGFDAVDEAGDGQKKLR